MRGLLGALSLLVTLTLLGCGGEDALSEPAEVEDEAPAVEAAICLPLGSKLCTANSSCCSLYCRKVAGATYGTCSR
ncbi:hypothetical protein MFUL124B02_28985 [Myxococcus fulvus 124B02]|nr:hypothetical protein MFUL124B02_28985 [Myxococcus fulvus 124B02]